MKVWTGAEVKAELADAFRILFVVPVQDKGCSSGAGFWPETYYEAEEIKEMRDRATTENRRLRVRPTPRQIQRMESILLGDGKHPGWLKRFMDDVPALRRVLVAAVIWDAAEAEFKAGCRRRGWAYSTFRRKRDEAAEFLAGRLSFAGVE